MTTATRQQLVLVVDHDFEIRQFIAKTLEGAGLRTAQANDAIEAFQWLGNHRPDLVMTDLMMPFVEGTVLIRWIKSQPNPMPVVVCSPKTDAATIEHARECGADDFIRAPYDPSDLVTRVKRVLRFASMITISPPTGLPGRRAIDSEIHRRTVDRRWFVLLQLDLSNFKEFNDRHGFARGDRVITAVARTIQEAVESIAPGEVFVGHLGADDFVVILPPEAAREASAAIRQAFRVAAADFDEARLLDLRIDLVPPRWPPG